MKGIENLKDEIFALASELALNNASARSRLIDWLTVTRGYSELLKIDPDNARYHKKLRQALLEIAQLA
jgi:hypothetical protein